ncbi:MAG: aspartate-semialdehyde dehydrogenase [Oscillospiraceae bacterium]|nr:aspartate-semialdehyde dehydrogenase [Oscillospiraceae bacterium]
MKTYKAAIVGATGMVGQRFVSLLNGHPWFKITALAASSNSAGKSYADATRSRWAMETPLPPAIAEMTVMDADGDAEKIAGMVDFIFCAVDMPKEAVRALEDKYALLNCPVVSNNSAHRGTPDVPMVIPEINPEHLEVIAAQRKRLGVRRGFVAVKSNCSLQSYLPALHPLCEFGIKEVLACTYQAISGAGKTFESWPEMVDNVIPYIGGEEEKSEREPLKIWGEVQGGAIVDATEPVITTQCLRVPVSDGHMAAVFVKFERPPEIEAAKKLMRDFAGEAQRLALPSAPKQFLHLFEEDNRPQTGLDRNLENGMAISVGRVRPDHVYDLKFVCLSHNTLRGAAGGAVLTAELLAAKGYFD